MSHKKVFGILLLILVLASFLRFINLKQRGLIFWDEAYFALEAKTVPTAFHFLLDRNENISLKQYLIEKGCIFPAGVAKPGYMAILSCWTFLFGSKDYTSLMLSAVLGVLTVLLVFFIGTKIYNQKIALFSAFILAISGYHILFSRSGFANLSALCFLTISIYYYLDLILNDPSPNLKKSFLVGLCFGFSYTVHYSLLPNIILIGVYEIIRIVRTTPTNRIKVVKTTLFLVFGMMFFPLFFEGSYRLVKIIFNKELTDIAAWTYFQYLGRQLLWSTEGGLNIGRFLKHDYFFYLRWLWLLEGPIITGLLFLSLGYFSYILSKRFSLVNFIIFTQVFLVLLFWIINPGVQARRALVSILSCMALLIGKTGFDIISRIRRKDVYKYVLFILITIMCFANIRNIFKSLLLSSNYKKTADFIKLTGEKEIISLNDWPIWQFYLEHKIYGNFDRIKSIQDLHRIVKSRKIRFLVTDFKEQYIIKTVNPVLGKYLDNLKTYGTFKTFPNYLDEQMVLGEQNNSPYPGEVMEQLTRNPEFHNIEIYQIQKLLDEKISS